jgi:hypothetical protein
MPKLYDQNLRRKVIDDIELNGMKLYEAADMFGVSRNTINLWFRHQAETGTLPPNRESNPAIAQKLLTGGGLKRFCGRFMTKRKRKWRNCGLIPLVRERLDGASKKSDLLGNRKS